MKNLHIFSYVILTGCLLLSACSSSKSGGGASTPKDTLLEVLTDFSVAINGDNFTEAVGFLVDEEKAQLTGPDGSISNENKFKLKALRLQVLIKNPKIKLYGGKLLGIVASLPTMDYIDNANSGSSLEEPTRLDASESAAPGDLQAPLEGSGEIPAVSPDSDSDPMPESAPAEEDPAGSSEESSEE